MSLYKSFFFNVISTQKELETQRACRQAGALALSGAYRTENCLKAFARRLKVCISLSDSLSNWPTAKGCRRSKIKSQAVSFSLQIQWEPFKDTGTQPLLLLLLNPASSSLHYSELLSFPRMHGKGCRPGYHQSTAGI